MSDAFLEFLAENGQRRYPFIENSNNLDLTDTFSMPDDAVLDIRGFHRNKPEITPRLAAIVGPTAALNADYPAVVDHNTLYFEMGTLAAPLRFAISVPVDQTIWPFSVTASVPDPIYAGVNLAVLHVTTGVGTTMVAASERWLFGNRLEVEPSLIGELYRQQIDCVRLVHDVAADEYVGGSIILRGGYNFDLSQEGQVITLEPSLGGGELGRFTGSVADEAASRCADVLTNINGGLADKKGAFAIKGGLGIEVVNLPAEHKIQLKISPAKLGALAC